MKEFNSKIEALKAAKIAAESRRAGEEVVESPVAKLGGFQDFTVPSKAAGRKKRHLPIAPRRRDTGSSQDDQEGECGFLCCFNFHIHVGWKCLSSHCLVGVPPSPYMYMYIDAHTHTHTHPHAHTHPHTPMDRDTHTHTH